MPDFTAEAIATATPKVRAWDIPTRVFHWSLVLLIVNSWASFQFAEAFADNTMKWHRYNGYTILVLLVWRVLWGFVGSSTSRWSAFLRWPWVTAQYAFDTLRGRERPFLGHNPLGSYMIMALLGAVGVQAVLGLMTVEHNDVTWGPLYKLVSEANQKRVSYFHVRLLNYLIWPLIVAHVTANIIYAVWKKDPLIRAMVTGAKPAGDYEDQAEAVITKRPILRALVCLGLAAVIVFGTIAALDGKILY